jgi:hypothetical protein
MPNRPAVHVRRYAFYEEVVVHSGTLLPEAGAPLATVRRGRDTLLPLAGRAALAMSATLLPLLAARLVGTAARRSLGPAKRQALPLPFVNRE